MASAPIGGTSGIAPLITRSQDQAKAALIKTQAKFEVAKRKGGGAIRTVLASGLQSSGVGANLDIKI